jgi:hypothetical protein
MVDDAALYLYFVVCCLSPYRNLAFLRVIVITFANT